MDTLNAKICPRCHFVVPAGNGVCDHCGRLFRTPIAQPFDANKTMMFYDASLPTAAPPPVPSLPRVLRMRQWLQRIRLRLRGFLRRPG